jgi:AdoMet-dependent rRNA methyltransferase SPB1
VVCREFIAPKYIDPKFLDPRHVFKDIAPLPTSITDAGPSNSHSHANVFMPEKKRRNRDGYAEGDYTLFHKCSASEFIQSQDPVGMLGTLNQIEFTSEEERA